jgi:hypothetical protein
MENLRSTLILILLTTFSQNCSSDKPQRPSIDGIWHGSFGTDDSHYGEAIYSSGNAVFYSDALGLQYRKYSVNEDTLTIYDENEVQNERVLDFISNNEMRQTIISVFAKAINGQEALTFYRVNRSNVDTSLLFRLDTVQQYKFMHEFVERRSSWVEQRKNQ